VVGRHQRASRADELARALELAARDRSVQRRVAALVARADAAAALEEVRDRHARLEGRRHGEQVERRLVAAVARVHVRPRVGEQPQQRQPRARRARDVQRRVARVRGQVGPRARL